MGILNGVSKYCHYFHDENLIQGTYQEQFSSTFQGNSALTEIHDAMKHVALLF